MVAERLRNARKAAGLTQEAAARMANLERNTVARYENGHRTPTLRGVKALAGVYGVPLGWFIDGVDEYRPEENTGMRDNVVEGLVFEGTASLAVKGTPVLYSQFGGVVGGMDLSFVGIALVACVAEEGWTEFDDTVVGVVPFPAKVFESKGVDPGGCNVMNVGGGGGGAWPAGSVILVDRGEKTLVDGQLYVWMLNDGVRVQPVRNDGGWYVGDGAAGWREIMDGEEVIGLVRWVSQWLV